MFKRPLLALAAIVLLAASHPALATSGACSWHGGVNCSAGAALDGNAVCSDGTESSVSYDAMEECDDYSSYAPSECGVPIEATCTPFPSLLSMETSQAQSMLNTLNRDKAGAISSCTAINARAGEYGMNNCSSTTFDSQITECQSALAYLSGCTTEVSQAQAETSCEAQDPNSVYDVRSSRCACDEGYVPNSGGKCSLPPVVTTTTLPDAIVNQPYSANVYFTYGGTDSPVLGVSGMPSSFGMRYLNFTGNGGAFSLELTPREVGTFSFTGNVTVDGNPAGSQAFSLNVVSADAACVDTYGPNAMATPSDARYCSCAAGYGFDAGKTACVADATVPVVSPATTMAPTLSMPTVEASEQVPARAAAPAAAMHMAAAQDVGVASAVAPSSAPRVGFFKRVGEFLRRVLFW